MGRRGQNQDSGCQWSNGRKTWQESFPACGLLLSAVSGGQGEGGSVGRKDKARRVRLCLLSPQLATFRTLESNVVHEEKGQVTSHPLWGGPGLPKNAETRGTGKQRLDALPAGQRSKIPQVSAVLHA